jgi:hypothetical protein
MSARKPGEWNLIDEISPKVEAITNQTAALTNMTNSGSRQEKSISELGTPAIAGG